MSILGGCGGSDGGSKIDDPEKVYTGMVKAAREKNGGYFYDILDSNRRTAIDTMIGSMMANLDKAPAEERGKWESLKGKSKREIYAVMMETDPSIQRLLKEDYRVLAVDTLVVLTVERASGAVDNVYLRWENGGYKLSGSPMPPPAQPPAGGGTPRPGDSSLKGVPGGGK